MCFLLTCFARHVFSTKLESKGAYQIDVVPHKMMTFELDIDKNDYYFLFDTSEFDKVSLNNQTNLTDPTVFIKSNNISIYSYAKQNINMIIWAIPHEICGEHSSSFLFDDSSKMQLKYHEKCTNHCFFTPINSTKYSFNITFRHTMNQTGIVYTNNSLIAGKWNVSTNNGSLIGNFQEPIFFVHKNILEQDSWDMELKITSPITDFINYCIFGIIPTYTEEIYDDPQEIYSYEHLYHCGEDKDHDIWSYIIFSLAIVAFIIIVVIFIIQFRKGKCRCGCIKKKERVTLETQDSSKNSFRFNNNTISDTPLLSQTDDSKKDASPQFDSVVFFQRKKTSSITSTPSYSTFDATAQFNSTDTDMRYKPATPPPHHNYS